MVVQKKMSRVVRLNLFTELHDAVFVVGALDETLLLRGMRFHPIDIETSVLKSDKRICER